jgi:glycosyltransferase involved in cell wall biosynthesis
MMTFGTVICTYNRSHLLEQCLASWSHSDYLPDQFIVVDASPDAEQYSSQIVQKFPQLFASPDSHYIITDQPGLTRQRNLGLKKLKTDIACFADDDTFITPTYVSKILEVFQNDSHAAIGGVNGVSIGQFDNWKQKNFRLIKNYFRHNLGSLVQRIHIPKDSTQLFEPLPSELQKLPLIHIDRLWGAKMNYRTEVIYDSGFDESFQRYGLYEDVDMSVRVGKTHKLVCRLDAEIQHDDTLGKSTRPNYARYFLASWLNSTYIIEKLFPCNESRNSHQRLFQLTKLISQTAPKKVSEQKLNTLGNEALLKLAHEYISTLKACRDRSSLGETFVRLQREIYELDI